MSLRNASRTLSRRRAITALSRGYFVYVKSEESPGCGGGTGPAGDDGTSHEICKQIANSQTAHGHGRPRARVDRTQAAPATWFARSTSRGCTRSENLSRVQARQDLIYPRNPDKGLIAFLIFLNSSDNLGSDDPTKCRLSLVANFASYVSGLIAVCLVSITISVNYKSFNKRSEKLILKI